MSLLIDAADPGPLAFAIAFGAGLLSFLSPCVLPLVPAYLGYLGGAVPGNQSAARARIPHAVAFVGGFLLLFVLFGAWLGLLRGASGLWGGAGLPVGLRDLDYTLRSSLVRIGAVLLVVLGARIADGALQGPWSTSLAGGRLVWPAQVWGLDQKWVRWAGVGTVVGLIVAGLSVETGAGRLFDALLLGTVTLTGAGPSKRQASVLALAAAILNGLAGATRLALPVDVAALVVQALAIGAAVAWGSRTDLFYRTIGPARPRREGSSLAASTAVGAVFAAGWTPCTGPNLAVILLLAGAAGTAAAGTALLATYALGLGVPFLAAALVVPSGSSWRVMNRFGPWLKGANAALLFVVAAMVLSGTFQRLASRGTLLFEL